MANNKGNKHSAYAAKGLANAPGSGRFGGAMKKETSNIKANSTGASFTVRKAGRKK